MIYRDGSWYLIAMCNLRETTRTFRLERIVNIEILYERYVYPYNFTISGYMKDSFGIFQGDTNPKNPRIIRWLHNIQGQGKGSGGEKMGIGFWQSGQGEAPEELVEEVRRSLGG